MTQKLLPGNAKTNAKLSQLPLPFLITGGERLLQFIWQFGYFTKNELTTTEGEPIAILSPGSLNKNQGPDFTDGRIRLGDATLAGTIELHLKTSDWRRHRHNNDPQYGNVILHVVFEHDEEVNTIPVLRLSSRISTLLLERYTLFMNRDVAIPCKNNISSVNELSWNSWKERLLVERLTRKGGQMLQLFEASNHHWEETFWGLLARAVGGKINGDAFESVARSVPVNLLAKHKASLPQLEALLLGQAGLLNDEFDEEYPKLLQREYRFLVKKYNLKPLAVPVLFLRMRPGAFPTLRLAQLAALIQQNVHLFSKVIEAENITELSACFDVTANDFWHYHYTLQQPSSFKKKKLGDDAINTILINAVVPAVFAYGLFHNNSHHKEKALRWLEGLPAESNSITKEFVSLGIQNGSAYDSQALIELRNSYCNEKRCLDCSVGNHLLREAAGEYKKALSPQ